MFFQRSFAALLAIADRRAAVSAWVRSLLSSVPAFSLVGFFATGLTGFIFSCFREHVKCSMLSAVIAAAYARVSTTDQNNELQISALTRYARGRRWKVQVFQDQMSGGKYDRPGLSAVMAAARSRLIDVVLVWKLDRFGRSTTDVLNNIKELQANGVRFIATTQGLDTDRSSPVSQFLLTILAAAAELERELICERVRAGILRAKSKGMKFGRPQVDFNRQQAREMRAGGVSIREIARTLEVGAGTIARLLKSPEPSGECSKKRGDNEAVSLPAINGLPARPRRPKR